jgi:hypothetical protein
MIRGARLMAALPLLGLAAALPAQPPPTKREAARAYAAALVRPTSTRSCLADIGRSRSTSLARYCRFVSGATHPPCNVRNSCAMMVEHIRYVCRGQGSGLPCADDFPGH